MIIKDCVTDYYDPVEITGYPNCLYSNLYKNWVQDSSNICEYLVSGKYPAGSWSFARNQELKRSKELCLPYLLIYEVDKLPDKFLMQSVELQKAKGLNPEQEAKKRGLMLDHWLSLYFQWKIIFFSLLKQKEKEAMALAVYSGNKSIHFAFLVDCQKQDFKTTWEYYNRKLFNGLADPSYASDWCKCFRRPNFVRKDTKKLQKLLYIDVFNFKALQAKNKDINISLSEQKNKQKVLSSFYKTNNKTKTDFLTFLKATVSKHNNQGACAVLEVLQGGDCGSNNNAYLGFSYLVNLSWQYKTLEGFQLVASEYISKAKELHNTSLPRTIEYYINEVLK